MPDARAAAKRTPAAGRRAMPAHRAGREAAPRPARREGTSPPQRTAGRSRAAAWPLATRGATTLPPHLPQRAPRERAGRDPPRGPRACACAGAPAERVRRRMPRCGSLCLYVCPTIAQPERRQDNHALRSPYGCPLLAPCAPPPHVGRFPAPPRRLCRRLQQSRRTPESRAQRRQRNGRDPPRFGRLTETSPPTGSGTHGA